MSQKRKSIARQNKNKKLLLIIPLLLAGLAVSYFALNGFSIRPTQTDEGGASLRLYYADGTQLACIGGDINISVFRCNYSSVPEEEVDAYINDFSHYEQLNETEADALFNESLFLDDGCVYLARVMAYGLAQWVQLHPGKNEIIVNYDLPDAFAITMLPTNMSDYNASEVIGYISLNPMSPSVFDYLPGIVQRPDDPFTDLYLTLAMNYSNAHPTPVINYQYGKEMVIDTEDFIQLNANLYGAQPFVAPMLYNFTAKDIAETTAGARLVYMDWNDPSYIMPVAAQLSL